MTSVTSQPAVPRIDGSDATRTCRMAQVLIVVVATLLHGIFLNKAKPLQSANDRSRWCTVWSLVELGTFQIDQIRQRPGWDTIDLVHVDGHYYSTKPPLLTVIIAGITWSIQKVSGWNLTDHTQSVTFIVLLLTNLLPFAISLVAWIAILERCAQRVWTRLFALTIAAFGTLETPFLMTLNNHTVAAASTMVAIYAVLSILGNGQSSVTNPTSTHDGPPQDVLSTGHASTGAAGWMFALCGFAAAWTVVNELPAAALGAILFGLAYRRSAKKTLAFFLPAAAIPVIALIATNIIATGSWKPTYADYGSDKYRFVIDGIPSYWMQPQGVDRNLDSPWIYFVHCTVGHHGIFSLTPIALLALVGWLTSFRLKDNALRAMLWASAVTSTIVLLFYLTRTQNYNYGGISCGLRWAVWLIPLWLIAMIPVLDGLSKTALLRGIAILLGAISIYSAWQPIDNPWRQPWLFQWMEARGWIDYSEDRPTLPRPLWTWFASLPKSEEPSWIEFTVAQPGSSFRVVRLTGRNLPQKEGTGEQIELEVQESTGAEIPKVHVRSFLIDIGKFNEGAPPADFLNWSDPNVTEPQQQADLAFVRGLPRKVPYEAKSVRYLKTPLRREAFRCQHVAAHVAYSAQEGATPLTYRCDAWLTDDVPFGVVQIDLHISDPENNVVLFHERWTARDCSPRPIPFQK